MTTVFRRRCPAHEPAAPRQPRRRWAVPRRPRIRYFIPGSTSPDDRGRDRQPSSSGRAQRPPVAQRATPQATCATGGLSHHRSMDGRIIPTLNPCPPLRGCAAATIMRVRPGHHHVGAPRSSGFPIIRERMVAPFLGRERGRRCGRCSPPTQEGASDGCRSRPIISIRRRALVEVAIPGRAV